MGNIRVKMKINYKILTLLLVITIFSCEEKHKLSKDYLDELNIANETQNKIIYQHLKNGAWKHELYSREWQEEIDKGLVKDSTIAYLWQQKAMPLFKQSKYEIGMKYIDKAVKYDRDRWQDYRAYIKCIFAKNYQDAITDFQDCKKRFGNSYVMDHTYDFYIGLSLLQLNEFKKAELIFEKDYQNILNTKGESWLHHLDLFYYGISKYEQKNYLGAIEIFNKSLKIYPEFSEVLVYKAKCLKKIGKTSQAKELNELGKLNGKKGHTINESGSPYERHPYQIRW